MIELMNIQHSYTLPLTNFSSNLQIEQTFELIQFMHGYCLSYFYHRKNDDNFHISYKKQNFMSGIRIILSSVTL